MAGYTSGPGPLNDHDFVIARLHADGSRDTAFGTGGETVISFDIGGQLFDFPERVLLQPDGKIVVVGAATESDTASDIAVARLTSSGALDSTFDGDGKKTLSFATGSGWKEDVNDALLQDDGKILIAGWVASNGDSGDFGVARLLPSGALDTTFSADGRTTISFDLVVGGSEEALGIALDKQGRILIHGTTAAPTVSAVDFAVARLLADGTLDPSFSGDGRTTIPVAGGDGWDRGVSVALDCTGRIVLLGDAHTLIPNADLGFAGLKPDGTLDPSFGNGGIRTVSFDLGGSNADSSRRVLIDTEGRPLALAEVTRSGPDDRDWAVVRLTGAGSCLFLDGFESGSTSAWSSP